MTSPSGLPGSYTQHFSAMQNKEIWFQNLYTENYERVIRLCLGYFKGDEQLAKDLTQEIFLKVWQQLPSFRNEAKVSTWIYRITVNTCLQELRKKKTKLLSIDLAASEPYWGEDTEQQFRAMYSCISKLSEENKTIILLELEGVPQEEIAQIVGISHSAVRTRIHRIKEKLSKCVSNEGL